MIIKNKNVLLITVLVLVLISLYLFLNFNKKEELKELKPLTMGEILTKPDFKNLMYAGGGGYVSGKSDVGIEFYASAYWGQKLENAVFILRHLKKGGEYKGDREQQIVYDILSIKPQLYCTDCGADLAADFGCLDKKGNNDSSIIAVYSISTNKVYKAWSIDPVLLKFKDQPDTENISCNEDQIID